MTTVPLTTTPPVAAKRPPSWLRTVRRLVRRPIAVIGLVVLALVVLAAVFGEQLAPYAANAVDVTRALQPPSGEHLFGTDELGRDVLSRVILAAQVSVRVALVSVSIALVAGVLLGVLAGYFGGWLDTIIMRSADVLFAFPVMLLAMAIVAILGPGLTTAMVAIGIVYIPIFARVTRASVLSVRTEPYVRAAVSLGAKPGRIIVRHVLPNIAAPIIVQTSLSLAFAILSEASLSFLGLGVQPPEPSWGRMLFDARGFLDQAWWMGIFPGAAVFVTVLACNLVGDALRDVLDVRADSGGKS